MFHVNFVSRKKIILLAGSPDAGPIKKAAFVEEDVRSGVILL